MRDTAKFPAFPELSVIDFSNTADARALASARHQQLFGAADDGYIDEYMTAIEDLFAGRHPGFQPMDTAYHDITHTLQASLCLIELMHNRNLANATPVIEEPDFRRALIAALFHDIGYLKSVEDTEGTGAKYTHVHEERSCTLAREFLARRGWNDNDIRFVENLISATGPRADLARIEFRSEVERTLGQAVCTADYVGQMSDPCYPDKLEVLFTEFAESYRYQGIPQAEWPFPSFEALLRSTPDFWSTFVQHKMEVECAGQWRYLEHPVSGENPYLEAIERNLATIRRRIDRMDNRADQGPQAAANSAPPAQPGERH
jgi:hypothetical protein